MSSKPESIRENSPRFPITRRNVLGKISLSVTTCAGLTLSIPEIIKPALANNVGHIPVMENGVHDDMTSGANRPGIFNREILMPEQLFGKPESIGEQYYKLTIADGVSRIVSDKTTPTWGYNGNYLGPTIRIRRNAPTRIHVQNTLNQSTTTHWHGAQVRGKMDGGPHRLIQPGDTQHYAFTLDQPAATLWYHPHPNSRTGSHTFAGLSGLLIIDDPKNAPQGLPETYGIDDIPLIVQDRALNPDGTLAYMVKSSSRMGMKGNIITVNGREQPYVKVPAQWVRFRILNGSNARIYYFGFHDNRHFKVIASDGGLLQNAVTLQRVLLAPSERVEIMVDLSKDNNGTVIFRSYSGEMVPTLTTMSMGSDTLDKSTFDILQLRVYNNNGIQTFVPRKLAEIERLSTSLPVRQFTLQGLSKENMKKAFPGEGGEQRPNTSPGPGGMSLGIGGQKFFAINHKYMEMQRINASLKLGSTEIWEFVNQSGMAHPLHYHGVSFQVLDVGGKEPPAELGGWKDTVLVPHNRKVRTIAQFKHHASAASPYMYHCHILEHEDNGMMGQFTVL